MKLLNYRNIGRAWPVWGKSVVRYSTPRKILNALRTELAYRRRTPYVKSYPYVLHVEPLYYCNLDCPLCDRQVFPDARKNSAGKLSLDLWRSILDEVGRYTYVVSIFGQGEPLLDWPLTRQIIEESHSRRIFNYLSTNSTLVTPTAAREAAACGLDHLVCAIDGISQETYQRYRVGGKVDVALQGMAMFVDEKRRQKSRLHIEWQFLVHKYNEHEIEPAKKIAKDMGVAIRFAPLRGMDFHPELQNDWLSANPDFRNSEQPHGQTVYHFPCYFLWRSLVINSNGKAARCLIYQNVAEYGHFADHSVHALFNDPSVVRARQLFSRQPVPDGDFPSPCATCSFYERHHGGPNQDKFQSLGRPSTNDQRVPLTISGQ